MRSVDSRGASAHVVEFVLSRREFITRVNVRIRGNLSVPRDSVSDDDEATTNCVSGSESPPVSSPSRATTSSSESGFSSFSGFHIL